MDHIRDAHDWHICDIGGHPVSIPLPVILYSSNGLEVFSSANFHHGHASYNGYKLEKGYIVAEDDHSFTDFSITKNVAAMMIGFILLIIIMTSVARSYKKGLGAPKGIGAFIEPLIVFLQDEVIKPAIGKKYARYMPLLLTMFFGIFILNLMGLIPIIPGGANVTGNIAFTLVLAVITFLVTTFTANAGYWKHIFMPDVPVALYLIVIPIEIIGVLNKPIVLMIRLFANITAGHIIILG
ncbi:MAG: F0F1 ATP synthase subunit A, partial [Bacteroidetes bacterium]|nr:F0F1 ATP synthase subunit A [Bacteroidota bacterium]